MNKSAGFAAILAFAVAAMRITGSPGPSGSAALVRGANASVSQAIRPAADKPPKQAATTNGGCQAYLRSGSDGAKAVYPRSSEKGDATDVLNRFFSLSATQPMPSLKNVRVVIALAPDPRRTQLSIMFDREMVALQQAAQDENFVYNASWMPWSSESTSYPLIGDSQIGEDLASSRAACPGLLLFRHYALPPLATPLTGVESFDHGLLVFVVGEQPTGGVNQAQWRNAIGWIQTYAPAAGADLSIVGPTFSGSLITLDRELKRLPFATFPRLQILSGAVSSRPSVDWFLAQQKPTPPSTLPATHKPVAPGRPASPHVDFGSFQENDELQIERFLTYWEAHGAPRIETTILSEDETVYGGIGTVGTLPCKTALFLPDGKPSPKDPCFAQPLRLYYPRDLSALRSQYQKEAVFSTNLHPSDHSVHSILQDGAESTDETHSGSDTIPAYSGHVTPLAQESLLYGIVSELRSHHARFVLLRCTNPLDFLFLTRFLHRAYPEGRIVLVGQDLLLRREIDTTEFRGVMGLTNYPLLPRDEHWSLLTTNSPETIQPHAHRLFESPIAEGTYLAARYSFAPEKILPGNTPTSPLTLVRKEALPGYADPFWLDSKTDQVPTWITVVGRDGFWPIAVLDETFQLPSQQNIGTTAVQLVRPANGMEPAPNALNLPLPWKIAALLVIALCLYQLYGILPRQEYPSAGLFAVFRPVPTPSQQVLLGLNCALAAAFLFEITILFQPLLVTKPFVGDDDTSLWVHATLALAVALLLVFFIFLVWPTPLQFKEKSAFGAQSLLKASVYALLATTCFVFWVRLLYRIAGHLSSAIPIFYRMGHLTSGVSPLLPTLFLSIGFYLWTWQALAGNLLLGRGRPLLPPIQPVCPSPRISPLRHWLDLFWIWFLDLPVLNPTPADGDPPVPVLDLIYARIGQPMARRIVALCSPLSAPFAVWFPPTAITLTVFLVFQKELLTSLEGSAFTYALNGALLLALFLTLAEASRLFWTWMELRRLLKALSRMRLRRTFTRLRAISASSLWSVSGRVHSVQHTFFHQQWDAASRLQLVYPDGFPALNDLVSYGRQFQIDGLSRFNGGLAWSEGTSIGGEAKNVRALCNQATVELLLWLDPFWKGEQSSLILEDQKDPQKAKDSKTDAPSASQIDKDRNALSMDLSDYPGIQTAEEFVCLHYIAFIQTILARMRTMILSMVCLFVAVCFAISFYPFVPRTQITVWMMLNLALIAFTVIYVYAGMERDETLSYITNTPPGKLGGDFWLKTAAFLSGPVLGLLTTQFPAITDSLLGWLQPGIDAFK